MYEILNSVRLTRGSLGNGCPSLAGHVLALVGEMREFAELFQRLSAGSAAGKAHEEPLHTRVEEEVAERIIRVADLQAVFAEEHRRRQEFADDWMLSALLEFEE